jgi:hypothetical protein
LRYYEDTDVKGTISAPRVHNLGKKQNKAKNITHLENSVSKQTWYLEKEEAYYSLTAECPQRPMCSGLDPKSGAIGRWDFMGVLWIRSDVLKEDTWPIRPPLCSLAHEVSHFALHVPALMCYPATGPK